MRGQIFRMDQLAGGHWPDNSFKSKSLHGSAWFRRHGAGGAMLSLEAVPVTIVATAISFLWSFVSGSRRSFGTFLSVSLATLANLLWLAWFFRDGMGPDAITTSGLGAWQNFWALAAVP